MVDISYKTLKTELNKWKKRHGVEKTAKKNGNTYYKIHVGIRKNAVIEFLKEMREMGFGEEYFRSHQFAQLLQIACFGGAPAFSRKTEMDRNAALEEELQFILDTEGIFDGKVVENKPIPVPERKPEPPKTEEKQFKPVGRDVNKALYAKDADYEPQLVEGFAEFIGISKDE
jgi:hypothetical protein